MDKIEVSQRAREYAIELATFIFGNGHSLPTLLRTTDRHFMLDSFARFEREILSHTPQSVEPVATDVAALVEAAKDLRDAIAHMAAPARVDPDKYFSEQVKAFGDAFGYGALMTTASALWRQDLGDLQGGEFAVGPCVTTAANQLKRLDTALAAFTKGQP